MIVCPNCNHHNPEGSTQCENCYTPLSQTTSCPNCGAAVQTDATFCGQCGYNLQAENFGEEIADLTTTTSRPPMTALNKDMLEPDESETRVAASSMLPSPWDEQEDLKIAEPTSASERESSWDDYETEVAPTPASAGESSWDDYETEVAPTPASAGESSWDDYETNFMTPAELSSEQEIAWEREESEQESRWESQEEVGEPEEEIDTNINPPKTPEPIKLAVEQELTSTPSSPVVSGLGSATQLQIQTAILFHVQTNTKIEIPQNLDVIHMGKPNSQIPPDIDVSGFPNSEIVSRIHADIRVEGDTYFIEDMGSSNGTYINHTPLLTGNRHRLRPGDRIALGKGDLVTFIFQLA